jgi:hypothetical protein
VKPLPWRPFLASTEVARTMVRAMRALIENCILNEVLMKWFLKIEEGVVESREVDEEVV